MKAKRLEWWVLLRVFLLLITLTSIAYLLVIYQYIYLVLIAPILIFQLTDLYENQLKAHREFNQFLEAVRCRDFSRHFNESQDSFVIQDLRKGFNEINEMFKIVVKEKEAQAQYLHKILELIDTGILSYEEVNGQIVWYNDALKKILNIPYLKTLGALSKKQPSLEKEISDLRPGESKISEVRTTKNLIKILISATAFQTDGRKYKLVAFQNVNEALDETESNAWQSLLRVLTHEIMNSIAPISSLADTLKNRLKTVTNSNFSDTIEDMELGVETIKRRSEGLLKFAETYRSLNKITKPNLEEVYVFEFFRGLRQLMQPTLSQKNIDFEIILKNTNLKFAIDKNLIEQVLINLLLNSIEAVKEKTNARITLSGDESDDGETVIKVVDNGSGIHEELLDKIFIPFFSTKKTGSGIGLTLSKQIMRLHRGSIQVYSREKEGSTFLLRFDNFR